MKNLKYIIVFAAMAVCLSSCYEEEYFLDDNSTTEGKHFPVIQKVEVEGSYDEGATVTLVMHYWSQDPVDHHELYAAVGGGAESLYSSTGYEYHYDSETQSEVVSLPYVVPAGSSGETVAFRLVVVNENGLSDEATTSIDIN